MPKGIYQHRKEWEHTERTREKMKEAQLGIKNHRFGKKNSDKQKKAMSKAVSGDRNPMKRLETRLKVSKSKMGHLVSQKTKDKISNSLKGNTPHNKGKKSPDWSYRHTPEIIEKIRQSKIELYKDKTKHPSWRNGKSFEEYTIDWTQTLKRSIRERDKYICQLCGKLQSDNVFHIHHKDYNKQNCNPDNLITLCKSCHMKTNQNRSYWINYFKRSENKN